LARTRTIKDSLAGPSNVYQSVAEMNEDELFRYFNAINNNKDHLNSTDDICTPMECVKKMLDYLPAELWSRTDLRVLDPCSGNGNFGAYCGLMTEPDNIWYNELNTKRFENCKTILSPKHISNKDFFELEGKWDLIMANPPYSGGGNKNRSLSNLFIERSIDLLTDGGYLCFVTPNNWMTYNNNNSTLKKLLSQGSFLIIDNDVKKYFPGVGSSFSIFVWQKTVLTNKTYVVNHFLQQDVQRDVSINKDLPFIPLYISQVILDLVPKLISDDRNKFNYRCDLHNFTQKKLLSDSPDEVFRYKTVHTIKKTRYASKKQDIFDRWNIIIPLSTYYIPKIMTGVNTTQSVGYISFDSRDEAEGYLKKISEPHFKLLIHLTRYGNFNNIKLLKHLNFDKKILLTKQEKAEVLNLVDQIKY
jgi:adenine-specific DNA-methyltransferase